jgi:hypothetical protein
VFVPATLSQYARSRTANFLILKKFEQTGYPKSAPNRSSEVQRANGRFDAGRLRREI